MESRQKQLGVLVRRERVRLEMKSQPALAKAAKISPRKVSDVERGEFAGPKTYDAIEAVFRWPAGSMAAYVAGTGPEPRSPEGEPAEAGAADGEHGRDEFEPGHDWTPDEVERVRGMSADEIVAEARMIGRFSGEEAQLRYLRKAATVKLEKRVSPPA